MNERVNAARKKHREAQEDYWLAIKRAYPRGAVVVWQKQGRGQVGRVLDHSNERLKVINKTTKKTYWIDAYWLLS